MGLRTGLSLGLVIVGLQVVGCGSSSGTSSSEPAGAPVAQEALNALRRPCVQNELCIRGFHWSPQLCRCVPDRGQGATCTTDDDCRLFSDYCTGCDCRSLSPQEPDPTCSGPGVRCFADPCMGQTAACVGGQCSFAGGPVRRHPHPPHQPHPPHAPHAMR